MIIFFISVGTVALLCFYYGDVEPLCSTIHYDKQYSFGLRLTQFCPAPMHVKIYREL